MVTISLCMIVKNEEEVIARCLESVADLVDEIILVDTGSTDRTKECAAAFAPRVFDFPWTHDFAAARNFSFAQATMDYCMWLDADDVLLAEDRTAFAALRAELAPTVDVVMMRYNTGFDEHGNVTFSYERERILKNHSGLRWVGAVHEVVPPSGNVIHSACAVTHRKLRPADLDRNLRIFERLLAQGQVLAPRQQFYYARELYYHARYEDALDVLEAFLEGEQGWLENILEACSLCAYCLYRLGREEAALRALLRSLCYDVPRAELCCDIGKHFFDRRQFVRAAFWYTRALECPREDSRGGFVKPDCYGYIPCIQLCVCYDALGDVAAAERFNDRAAAFQPNAAAVAANRRYFALKRAAL